MVMAWYPDIAIVNGDVSISLNRDGQEHNVAVHLMATEQ